jgi:hypothetical protein
MTVAQLPASLRKRIAIDGDHWVWTGRFNRHGVPAATTTSAAREVWQALECGPLMEGEGVYRACDRHGCVNPDHQEVRLTSKAKSRRAA